MAQSEITHVLKLQSTIEIKNQKLEIDTLLTVAPIYNIYVYILELMKG